MECFRLTRALDQLRFAVPEAEPLVRRLLRVAGRVVIDMAVENADPEVWTNTREMALQWIGEALEPLGYEVTPPRNP